MFWARTATSRLRLRLASLFGGGNLPVVMSLSALLLSASSFYLDRADREDLVVTAIEGDIASKPVVVMTAANLGNRQALLVSVDLYGWRVNEGSCPGITCPGHWFPLHALRRQVQPTALKPGDLVAFTLYGDEITETGFAQFKRGVFSFPSG